MAGIDPRYYYLTLGLLALCTLVGLILAYSFQREVNDDLVAPTARDVFDPIEKAYYSGLMDKAEFERIQESIARKKSGKTITASRGLKTRPNPIELKPADPTPISEAETETDEE